MREPKAYTMEEHFEQAFTLLVQDEIMHYNIDGQRVGDPADAELIAEKLLESEWWDEVYPAMRNLIDEMSK